MRFGQKMVPSERVIQCTCTNRCVFWFGVFCSVAVGVVMTLDLSDLYRLNSKNRLTVMFMNDLPLQFIADS